MLASGYTATQPQLDAGARAEAAYNAAFTAVAIATDRTTEALADASLGNARVADAAVHATEAVLASQGADTINGEIQDLVDAAEEAAQNEVVAEGIDGWMQQQTNPLSTGSCGNGDYSVETFTEFDGHRMYAAHACDDEALKLTLRWSYYKFWSSMESGGDWSSNMTMTANGCWVHRNK